MKKSAYRQGSILRGFIPALIIFIAVAAMIFQGLQSAGETVNDEGLRNVEQSIQRAVVTCYSIENRYPDTYEYLAENYGLQVDTERYIVHYDIFASNIMPSISVVGR